MVQNDDLDDVVETFENFLLVTACWIGPSLSVVLADRLLNRSTDIVLFSNQSLYVGLIAKAFPPVGDITFEVGFLLASGLYAALHRTSLRTAV